MDDLIYAAVENRAYLFVINRWGSDAAWMGLGRTRSASIHDSLLQCGLHPLGDLDRKHRDPNRPPRIPRPIPALLQGHGLWWEPPTHHVPPDHGVVREDVSLALSEMSIDLLPLLGSLAVFSLIIGLAIQQTLGNIVNSFMLAIDRPFEVGGRIEVDGVMGNVMSIGILSTKVLTLNEELVVIPNNTLIDSTVMNYAHVEAATGSPAASR